jgi:hypothetical protein
VLGRTPTARATPPDVQPGSGQLATRDLDADAEQPRHVPNFKPTVFKALYHFGRQTEPENTTPPPPSPREFLHDRGARLGDLPMLLKELAKRRAAGQAAEAVTEGVVHIPPSLAWRAKDSAAGGTRPPAESLVVAVGPLEDEFLGER